MTYSFLQKSDVVDASHSHTTRYGNKETERFENVEFHGDTGLSDSALSQFYIRRGDPLLLRRPDGSTVATRVHSLTFSTAQTVARTSK
jgi:hypothetical protein